MLMNASRLAIEGSTSFTISSRTPGGAIVGGIPGIDGGSIASISGQAQPPPDELRPRDDRIAGHLYDRISTLDADPADAFAECRSRVDRRSHRCSSEHLHLHPAVKYRRRLRRSAHFETGGGLATGPPTG